MEIKFTCVGVLVLDNAANCLPLNEDNDNSSSNSKHYFSSRNVTPSRNSYYSSSPDSSNCTPKSITADLTNVIDPVLVKKKLLTEREKINFKDTETKTLIVDTLKKIDDVVEKKLTMNNDACSTNNFLPVNGGLLKNGTSKLNVNGFTKSAEDGTPKSSANGTLKPESDGVLNFSVNGTPKSNVNGVFKTTVNGTLKSTVNGTSKSTVNGTSKSIVNGTPKSTVNGVPKLQVNGVLKEDLTPNGSSMSESTSTNGSLSKNLTPLMRRKRLLSDRGEQELEYPICDARTSAHGWSGCSFLRNRQSGVGLCNSSNDCFLNAVLQSVVHTSQLARFLVEKHDENICNVPNPMHCLNCNIKKHILRATSSTKPFEAYWIRQFLSKFFPSHRHGHQEDAHEMLTLLLGALEPPLHKRQNGVKSLATPSSTSPFSTPIEQIFGGNLRNQICCDTCNTVHTNYEKIREINLGLTRHANARIIELIQDFFAKEQLQYFMCKNCKCKRSATRHTTILRAPSVLIVQLKRFNLFGGKNRLPIRPDLTLQLGRFSFSKEPITYRLNGIIEHIGGGVNFGHYVSAWRGFDERSWFYFDDSEVFSINVSKVESMEPYILFFNRVPNDSSSSNAGTPLQPSQRNHNDRPSEKRFCFTPFTVSSTQSQNRPSLNSKQFQRHSINTSLPLFEKHVQ